MRHPRFVSVVDLYRLRLLGSNIPSPDRIGYEVGVGSAATCCPQGTEIAMAGGVEWAVLTLIGAVHSILP